MLFGDLVLFCLHKVAHFIARFFAFRFGFSVMHGTLWRPFLDLLNPSSWRLVHLVLCHQLDPLLKIYRYVGLRATLVA